MGDIYKKYSKWLFDLVDSEHKYSKLYALLHSIPFRFSMEMDGNRYEDGLCLRRDYIYEKHLNSDLYDSMASKPCSVMEMMVALACRCEQHIMQNGDYGNRTEQWFKYMISSLGLIKETDDQFDERFCRWAVDKCLNRAYSPNGIGGLFYIPNASEDLRKIEIWDQAMLYLNTILF